jgi:HD superfamily phosphohydrolase
MEHICQCQPELNIEPAHVQAIVLAALCHDLGQGPFSRAFIPVARSIDPRWSPSTMATSLLKYIVETHGIGISSEVINAACNFILGYEYDGFPKWLSYVVSNRACGIDLCKFDCLSRDINRTLNTNRFEYDRLIVHCRVIGDELSWKLSEVPTIEYLFYNRNDMFLKVYSHRVVQALEFMIHDIFELISGQINLEDAVAEASEFSGLDDRILFKVATGRYGTEAALLAANITSRNIYRFVGEIKVKPLNEAGERYSQRPATDIADDICRQSGLSQSSAYRVLVMKYRSGLSLTQHPLLSVPFWKPGEAATIRLRQDDLSCLSPANFAETTLRVFVTERSLVAEAKNVFDKWRESGCFSL